MGEGERPVNKPTPDSVIYTPLISIGQPEICCSSVLKHLKTLPATRGSFFLSRFPRLLTFLSLTGVVSGLAPGHLLPEVTSFLLSYTLWASFPRQRGVAQMLWVVHAGPCSDVLGELMRKEELLDPCSSPANSAHSSPGCLHSTNICFVPEAFIIQARTVLLLLF